MGGRITKLLCAGGAKAQQHFVLGSVTARRGAFRFAHGRNSFRQIGRGVVCLHESFPFLRFAGK